MKLKDDSSLIINKISDLSIPDSPEIKVQLKDGSFSNNKEKIKDELKINKDSKIKIRILFQKNEKERILIYQNDKLINEIRGEMLTRGVDEIIELNLSNEKNSLKAVTLSKEKIESNSVVLELPVLNNNYKPKAYILGIGINDYQDKKLKLKYSISDIKEVLNYLEPCIKNIYNDIEIIEIYNSDSNKSNINTVFNKLISKVNVDDLFIFLYAGHGYSNKSTNNEFIMILQDNSILYSNELIDYLTRIKANKQIVSIDSCHSGSFIENIKFYGSLEEKSLALLSRFAGFAVYAATAAQNHAIESEKVKHGIYTYTLIEGFNGNAADKNGYYFITGLENFLKNSMPIYSIKLLNIVQYPVTYTFGNDFYFARMKEEIGKKN